MAYTTTGKKILAFVLIICLTLCNANIPASASGTEEKIVEYTFQCKVEGTNEKLTNFEVTLEDSSGKVIDSTSKEYELIVGEKYKYTIKMDGIQDFSEEFEAEEKEGGSFEKVVEIPSANLISLMENKKCYVGETVSINDKWKELPWKWESSSEQVATVKDGEVTGVKPGTATITRSYKGIKHQAEVTVEEYVKPLFTIDGVKLEDITELKKDATVKLKCTNYNQLSNDTDKWQISISGGAATELTNEEYSVTCSGDKLSFTCQLGSRTEDYTINIFKDYVLKAYFQDEVIENAVFTPAASDLKPGVATEVTVTAEGFQDITVDVTPVSYKREIEVPVGKMQTPKISYSEDTIIQAYCGGNIDLNAIEIEGDFYKSSLPWKWYFDGKPVEGTNINLNEVKEGEYIVKYVYCDEEKQYEVSSNEITVKVDKLKLKFDFDNWAAKGKREYDTTDEFDLKIPLSSSDISLAEPAAGKKEDYSCLESGDLEIKVKVDSADASTAPYARLTVADISVSCNSDMYDLSLIKDETVGKVKNNNVNLTIDFKVMTVTRFMPYFEYRTKHFSFDKTNEAGIFLNDKNHTNFTSKLLEMLGTPNIIDNENCNFSKVQYDEVNNVASVKDKNVEYVFDENTYSKTDDKKVTFTYGYTYEILHIKNILDIIQLKNVYEGPDVKDSFWVNGKDKISASLKESDYNNPESAYNGVSFKKIEVTNWEALEEYNISGEGGSKGHKAFAPSGDNEEYYAVMFDTENYEKCSTVAAIIRIIPKEDGDFSGNYPCRVPDTDDEEGYPVITLFRDSTAAEVEFEEEENEAKLNRANDSDIVVGEVSRPDNIKFTVKDNGSGVKSVKCAIVSLDLSSKYYDKLTKTYVPAGIALDKLKYTNMDLLESENEKYTMNVPPYDGEYVICVKTKNGSGMEETHISNGFFIDSEPPEITASFIKDREDKTEEDITEKVINGEEVYSSGTIRATIKIKEKHLKCGQVIITKKDYEGNPINEKISYNFDKISESDVYATDQIVLEDDANYQIEVKAIDKAGNPQKQSSDEYPKPVVYKVTVDKTVPHMGEIETAVLFDQIKSNDGKEKGVVSMVKDISYNLPWLTFVPEVLYSVFSKDTIKYTMSGSDKISPVEIGYYLSAEPMNEIDLNKLPDESWHLYDKTENNIIEVNKSCFIYERVKDRAGNISYFSTEGMITDNHKPDIFLSLNKEANKNGFYNGDVLFSADIEDKIPEGGTASSGLQYVAYYLERGGKHTSSKVIYDISQNKKKEQDTLKIEKESISAKEFNSNDVTLCVTAVDNAGNKSTEEIPLKIDNVKPEISVSYDDQAEGEYCNHTRTATISIKERNLNTDDVKIVAKGAHGNKGKVGKWSHSSNTGKSDDAVYTCKVTFTEDDDYEFTVSCVDKAGNKAKKNFSDKFTVDATKPVISVSYNGAAPEQNAYYKEPITATITITEHNFNAGKVDIQMHADNSSVSGVSGFSSNGDIHTATVSYSTDGTYGLDVAYTDEAGNAADSYSGNTFTVDLIEPEIEITNIRDKSANKGDVKPVITCTDVNYDSDKVAIKLYGANNGEIDLKDVSVSSQAINNGEQYTLDFPKTQVLDDVYTLTAEVTDKAGNETEKSIEFSVNRFGSVYTLGTETGEWLTNGVCSYIQEGRQVVIVETNVDEVVERNIAYTQGGVNAAVVTVNEVGSCSSQERENGTYYQMKDRRDGNQWYQYEYTIHADNFLSEGRYSVQIDSTDKAGNHTSNVSNKHTEGNLVVEFAVDQTAPSAVVTGAEDRKVYNETSHTVYLDVQDNLATDYVTVYLNGEEYGTYKASDIEELENGLIPVKVGQALSTQTIQLMAKDMAGNILSEKSEGKYDKSFDDFHIVVTTNPLVRFLHTTWLWLLLLMIFAICGISVFIIVKRKRVQMENQSDIQR
jgi:hypothetical protein